MFDIADTTRYIIGFSKTPNKNGSYLAEVAYEFTRPLPLSFFQDLFGIPYDYPDESIRYMIESYPLDKIKADACQPFVKEKIDLEKYDLFLECADKESHKKWIQHFEKEEEKLTHEDLIRFIDAYPEEPDENGELNELRFELQKPITIEFLNKVFHVDPASDKVFFGDELNEEQAKALQPYFKEKLDTERYLLILTAKRKTVEEKK